MAITYDAPSNTITVTGYTEGVPCTFNDIWLADQAGEWGVVTRSTNAYGKGYWFQLMCKLNVGDGSISTYFADEQKLLSLDNYLGNIINVKSNAFFTLTGVSIYSVNFGKLIYRTGTGNIKLYDCEITTYWGGSEGGIQANEIRRCNFYGGTSLKECADAIVDRLTIVSGGADVFPISFSYGTFNDIIVRDSNYALLIYNIPSGSTIKGLQSINNTYDFYVVDFPASTFNLVNTVADWKFNWVGENNVGAKIYRQYTFNLQVTEEDGTAINAATVTLKDKDGNNVFSVNTNASGVIAEQTVSRGYYDQAHGNTLQDYSPHTLTVSKSGYVTYIHEGITLDEPVDWRIALLDALTGNAAITNVATGKTFYKDDPRTKLTGTYTSPPPVSKGGVVEKKVVPAIIPTVDGHLLVNVNRKKHDYIQIM